MRQTKTTVRSLAFAMWAKLNLEQGNFARAESCNVLGCFAGKFFKCQLLIEMKFYFYYFTSKCVGSLLVTNKTVIIVLLYFIFKVKCDVSN